MYSWDVDADPESRAERAVRAVEVLPERSPVERRWVTLGDLDPGGFALLAQDSAFRDVIGRLLVIHELKKVGALTYDEFTVLKGRMLDL